MYNLINDLKLVAATANIPTVGFQTLLCVLTNGASGAQNYEGTKAEASVLLEGTTVKMSANADGSNSYTIDPQYLKARTIAGTKNAMLEIVLPDNYVASITLPTNVTATVKFLTLPTNSVE